MEQPKRKKNRLQSYDYSQNGAYFITICTENRKCLLASVVGASLARPAHVRLTEWGQAVEQAILRIPQCYPDVHLEKYVVMPNHIHLILELHTKGLALSDIIGQYKSFVTRKIHGTEPFVRVWQASYHDHVIRNQRAYETIWLYIDSNAQNWEKDCFFAK